MEINDPDRDALARAMRKARDDAGLTQQQVADRFSLSKGTVSAWEKGRGIPDALMLVNLTRMYGCSADALLGAGAPVHWPFSDDLLEAVSSLEGADLAALEAVMRAHLRMAPDGVVMPSTPPARALPSRPPIGSQAQVYISPPARRADTTLTKRSRK
jgi:transcriptional regulator with XRE-family HTH domain